MKQLTSAVKGEAVASIEDGEGRKRGQPPVKSFAGCSGAFDVGQDGAKAA
jgi:hypothetical protein